MDLMVSLMKDVIYEAVYEPNGNTYEFISDEALKPMDLCKNKGSFVIVVKIKPKSQKRYGGVLSKLVKIKNIKEIV